MNRTVDVVIPYKEKYTPQSLLSRAKDSVAKQSVTTNIIVRQDDGVSRARNQGLKKTNHQYVAFLDADDYWDKNKLSRQITELERSGNGICLTNSKLIQRDDTTGLNEDPNEALRSIFLGKVYGLTSSILIDTEKVATKFDSSLDRREDHLFIISAAAEAGLSILEETLTNVDRHGSGLSSDDDPYMKFNLHKEFYVKSINTESDFEQYRNEFWHFAHRNVGYLHYVQNNLSRALYHYMLSFRYNPRNVYSLLPNSVVSPAG